MVSYQILGLPQESLASMVQTLAFHARLPVLLGASPFYRIPNAPIARGLELTAPDYVRARLTAMAVETAAFTRADIYTLFVTTRILNFLKGLALPANAQLHELLDHPWGNPRLQIGMALLQRLRTEGTLYFWTRQGQVANQRFKVELFRRVLQEAGHIVGQNGTTLAVDTFANTLCLP
jgi:hypothetical protein